MTTSRRALWLFLWLMATMAAMASPRSIQQMQREAKRVLAAVAQHADATPLRQLDKRKGFTVIGYDEGGFAVVADDDCHKAVLAYSPSAYDKNTSNSGFIWWMQAMETALAHGAFNGRQANVASQRKKGAEVVTPLLTTTWDQGYPFNMLCPGSCPTGCVATATAQVLKHFGWPHRGTSTAFTYVPFGDHDRGFRLEAVLDDVEYRYDLMADNYFHGSVSQEQREAVALLMYHVGLSVKSIYDSSGTGSYNETLCHGLRRNLDYPYAVTINRADYTEAEWMDIIYKHISEGIPLIYGGADADYYGHEFVLDGYDAEGAVHINWGWGGSMDGYFVLEGLGPSYYDFSLYQDMVVGCSPDRLTADTVTVALQQAGTLQQILDEAARDTIVCLAVGGPLNGNDLRLLRAMAGCDAMGHGTMGRLSVLDLSEARIVAGGEAYLSDSGEDFFTRDDVMPWMAFAHCAFLVDVTLPRYLHEYEGAVFANCFNLDRVRVEVPDEADFVYANGYVLSADSCRLIEYLPDGTDEIVCRVPDGVTEIADYAFAGRYLYEWLCIPASVERIGKYAFNRCFNLTRTYVGRTFPPAVDPTAIDNLDLSLRTLYVPKGSSGRYLMDQGWGKYRFHIREYDATSQVGEIVEKGKSVSGHKAYDIIGRPADANLGKNPRKGILVVDRVKQVVR